MAILHPYRLPSALQTELEALIGRRMQWCGARVLASILHGAPATPLTTAARITGTDTLIEQIDAQLQTFGEKAIRASLRARITKVCGA